MLTAATLEDYLNWARWETGLGAAIISEIVLSLGKKSLAAPWRRLSSKVNCVPKVLPCINTRG